MMGRERESGSQNLTQTEHDGRQTVEGDGMVSDCILHREIWTRNDTEYVSHVWKTGLLLPSFFQMATPTVFMCKNAKG